MLTLHTNVAQMSSLNTQRTTGGKLSAIMRDLSTGKKNDLYKNDPAAARISAMLNMHASGTKSAISNMKYAQSSARVAQGALDKANELLVTLPTNFKCARFEDEKDTQIIRDLEKDVDAARFDTPEGKIELPVKLKAYDSIWVPLAKWAMLLAGNYRCITKDGMRTAQEAVHSNIEESRSVYNFVFDLCVKLGAKPEDLVPFEKYAAAAQSLVRPASAARALQNGAPNIERADKLVQLIARQRGLSHPAIDAQVELVDRRLEQNRKAAK